MKINHLDLFSGIGGFSLGLQQAGIEPDWIGYSDTDKYCNEVFKRNFQNAEELGSITDIQPEKLPNIDLITFGFPCQDLSVGGKRGGLHADRSGLFFKAIEIVNAKKPKYFIFENVKGLFSSSKGQDFKIVLQNIADIGYDGQWQLCNTRHFGLPQNRERIYFIGHIRGEDRPKVFPIRKGNKKIRKTQGKSNDTQCIRTITTAHSHGTATNMSYINSKGNIRRLTPNECSRMQGFSWKNEDGTWDDSWSDVGISDTQRYKQFGNAVSVPVVKAIMEKLYSDSSNRKKYAV